MILFVEFDPSQYSKLIEQLGHYGNELLFLNRRRTAIWNVKSIKLLTIKHNKKSPNSICAGRAFLLILY